MLPKYCKSIEKFIIRLYSFFSSWRQVEEDDNSEFHYLEQEIHTNSSVKLTSIGSAKIDKDRRIDEDRRWTGENRDFRYPKLLK